MIGDPPRDITWLIFLFLLGIFLFGFVVGRA